MILRFSYRFLGSRFPFRNYRFVPVLVPVFYIYSIKPTAHKFMEAQREWSLAAHFVAAYIASPLPHSPLPSRGGTKLMLH